MKRPTRPRASRRTAACGLLALTLVVVSAAASAQPDDSLGRALAYLDHTEATGPWVVEAAALAGLDARSWPAAQPALDRLRVVENDGTIGPLRALHAAVATGYDPTEYKQPDGRTVNLLAQLREHIEQTSDASNDAVFSFQLLALHAAGDEGALLEQVKARLVAAQRDDGAWGCAGVYGIECTAFALVALSAAGMPESVADLARAYVGSTMQGDGWGTDPADPSRVNTQQTAWGIQALQALEDAVPVATWSVLLANQGADGAFWHAGQPDSWATADAAMALAGGLPGPRFANAELNRTAPSLAGPFDDVTWSQNGRTWSGLEPQLDGATSGTVFVHATGPGVHFRGMIEWPGETSEAAGMPIVPMLGLALVGLAAVRRSSAGHPYSL